MPDVLGSLSRLGGGFFLEELHEAIVQTVQEVIREEKAGTVTVTLKISQPVRGQPMVQIDEGIARKSPSKDSRGAVFFEHEGALHREDPRQPRMDLHFVDKTTGEIRTLDDAERELRQA